jgi:hypothetical protein
VRLPHVPSRAELIYDALKQAHDQFQVSAKSAEDLPAWFVLTPAGPIRIRTIGTFRSFVQFVTPEGDVLLLAPEAVNIRMQRLPPGSDQPRFPLGFSANVDEVAEPAESVELAGLEPATSWVR